MALTERKRYQKGRPRRRTFRRRRRTGLFVFVGLVVLTLGALIFFGANPLSQEEVESVERVADPNVAGTPEAVPEQQAAQEEPTAQEEATEEEAALPPPPDDPTMFLTVPKLGVYGHTVRNDRSQEALDLGAIKLPQTGFPWQERDTNTYIAGHRIGWPGTETYYQFYNLPSMQQGDEVFLTDANGTVYTYRVSEMFAVSPDDTWVTNPIPGRDVVSLQTCTETPDDWWTIGPRLFESGPESGRLIVRADRVP